MEELDLLEKKQAMRELWKERRKTKVQWWRGTVAAGGGVTQTAVAGSRSSEVEGDLLVRGGSSSDRHGGGSGIIWPSQGEKYVRSWRRYRIMCERLPLSFVPSAVS